ncbi:MAG: ATP-binding protein [bacterium]|nr:ATP-binding protein [bacterium]
MKNRNDRISGTGENDPSGTGKAGLSGAAMPEHETVLLVDDDENIIRSLEFIFKDKYNIISCLTGSEALEKFSQNKDKISAVLLDIKMDDKDGIEIFQEIKKIEPSIPIIFNTAYPGEYKPLDLIQTLHPFGYIVKGSDPAILYDNLASAVEYRQLINEKDLLNVRLRKINTDLKFLYEASQKLTSILEKNKLHDEINKQFTGLGHSQYILYYFYNNNQWELINPGFCKDQSVRQELIRLSLDLIQQIEKKQKAVIIKDVYGDASGPETIPVRSIMALPIFLQDILSGIIIIMNREIESFSNESEYYLLETLAYQIAVSLNNLVLIEDKLKNKELSVLGKMAATIVHDINNPLMVIMNGLDSIRSRPHEKIKSCIYDMSFEVERICTMLTELTEFIKKGTSNAVFSRQKIDDLIRLYCTKIKKLFLNNMISIKLDLNFRASILLDRDKFLRVLQNLFSNARDAIEENGKISVSTQKKGRFAEIRISDTGKGMSREVMKNIFEPFYSEKKQKGLGLGMYIVKQIILQHKGSVSVESNLNKGTSFIIKLPSTRK